MAADPLGRTVVDLDEKPRVEIIELDFTLLRETREKLPLLKNRRSDVYARHAADNKLP
jgi:predicted amidohydrolase